MPFVDDGNLYTIITQALEERYGQNDRKGPFRAQFRVSLADRAIFQAFWKIGLLLELWRHAHKYASRRLSLSRG